MGLPASRPIYSMARLATGLCSALIERMTAIAIWRTDEIPSHPNLWAVADSRISKADGEVLIEDGVKILPLQIVCRSPGTLGFFDQPYFTHTIGYCFAGSTLMGQNCYLRLIPLLSSIASPEKHLISIRDVAEYALSYVSSAFDDYKITQAHNALFEVAIFGYCHSAKQFEVYKFRPAEIDGIIRLQMEEFTNLQDNEFVYLGDKPDALRGQIEAAFASDPEPGRPTNRAPRFVIGEKIEDADFPSIGGDLQIAIVSPAGYQPYALMRPDVTGQPTARISYLGRDFLDDLYTIGPARISLNAIP